MPNNMGDATNIPKYGVHIGLTQRCRDEVFSPRRAACEILSHHGKCRCEAGKEFLSDALDGIVHFEAEPTSKRPRDDIGKAISRHDGGDKFAESFDTSQAKATDPKAELPTPATVRV